MLILMLALIQNNPIVGTWVPANTGEQICGMDAHSHQLSLDDNGNYIVDHQKGEPDIVFDGKCHSNSDESIVNDPDRKVLPKPKSKEKN